MLGKLDFLDFICIRLGEKITDKKVLYNQHVTTLIFAIIYGILEYSVLGEKKIWEHI